MVELLTDWLHYMTLNREVNFQLCFMPILKNIYPFCHLRGAWFNRVVKCITSFKYIWKFVVLLLREVYFYIRDKLWMIVVWQVVQVLPFTSNRPFFIYRPLSIVVQEFKKTSCSNGLVLTLGRRSYANLLLQICRWASKHKKWDRTFAGIKTVCKRLRTTGVDQILYILFNFMGSKWTLLEVQIN